MAKTWVRGEGDERRLTTGRTRLAVGHEFSGKLVTTFATEDGPIDFQVDPGKTWLIGTVGGTAQVSGHASAFFSGSYLWDTGDRGHGWSGRFGMRLNW